MALQIKLMLCSAKDGLIFISFPEICAPSEVYFACERFQKPATRMAPADFKHRKHFSLNIPLLVTCYRRQFAATFSDLLALHQACCAPRLSGTIVISPLSWSSSSVFRGLVRQHEKAESSLLELLYRGEACVGVRYEGESVLRAYI